MMGTRDYSWTRQLQLPWFLNNMVKTDDRDNIIQIHMPKYSSKDFLDFRWSNCRLDNLSFNSRGIHSVQFLHNSAAASVMYSTAMFCPWQSILWMVNECGKLVRRVNAPSGNSSTSLVIILWSLIIDQCKNTSNYIILNLLSSAGDGGDTWNWL